MRVNFACQDPYNEMSINESYDYSQFKKLHNTTNDNLFKLAAFFEIKRLLQQAGQFEIEKRKRIQDLAVGYQVMIPEVSAFVGILKS